MAMLLMAACEQERAPSTWTIVETAPAEALCGAPGPELVGEAGDSLVLASARQYCDILAVPVATLRASSDGAYPDPGSRALMTSGGRYYTTAARGQQVLEWSADGTFLRAVGSSGGGPGEFSPPGALLIFLDPADTLFVLDGGNRWTVFDPDLVYQRTFQGRFHSRNASTMHAVGGRGILTTADVPGAGAQAPGSFHWMQTDGSGGSSFGPPRDDRDSELVQVERLSALAPNGGFWVVPPNGAARGMTLEHWTFEGERMLTLERHVPWLPREGYPSTSDQSGPNLPEYDLLHVDAQGLIWVIVAVRDPRWREVPRAEMAALQNELYDARMEVVDPQSARVVASFRFDGPDEELPPFSRFLGNGRRSFRITEDASGLRSIEIYDLYLARK